MKSFFFATCVYASAFSLLLTVPQATQAQALGTSYTARSVPPLRGILRASGKGFIVETPLLVADSGVRQVMATPNGARLVVLRQSFRVTPDGLLSPGGMSAFGPQTLPAEASVTVWNTYTQKGTVVWRQRIEPGELLDFETTGTLHGPNGDRVLVTVVVLKPNENMPIPRYAPAFGSVLLVDTEKNTARQVNIPAQEFGEINGALGYLDPSPSAPFAAVVGASKVSNGTIRFMRHDGSLTNSISLPGVITWKDWQKNGTVLRGSQMVHAPFIDKKDVAFQWFEADPRKGILTAIEAPPKTKPVVEEPPAPDTLPELELVERPAPPQSGTFAPSVWLQAKSAPNADPKVAPGSVLLFAEGTPVFLLPRAAVFLSNGALYASGLQTVSEAKLVQMERKAKRDRTLSNTKQIGLAFMMYLQDNDIKFPATAGNLTGDIGGYLKNATLLNGFVYTPPNPLGQAQMTDVGQTVLGYLPGDGGKAVLYADGHVKWQDTP